MQPNACMPEQSSRCVRSKRQVSLQCARRIGEHLHVKQQSPSPGHPSAADGASAVDAVKSKKTKFNICALEMQTMYARQGSWPARRTAAGVTVVD